MVEPISFLSGVGKTVLTGLAYGATSELGRGAIQKLVSVLDDKSYKDASEFIRACEGAGGRVEYQDRGRETIVTCYFEKSDFPDL